MTEEIKETARQQMARDGAAALSLRAIAARMGLTAPALYRYFADRDALITALIVDAFDALGDALRAARAACPPDAHADQFVAIMGAYRAWALAHPADFILIYGTPIPGYEAPAAITAPAAQRSTRALLDLLHEAWQAGTIAPPADYADTPSAVRAHLSAWGEGVFGHDVPVALLHAGFIAWAHLQGLIMLELFGHLQPVIGDPAQLYRFEVDVLARRLGIARGDAVAG